MLCVMHYPLRKKNLELVCHKLLDSKLLFFRGRWALILVWATKNIHLYSKKEQGRRFDCEGSASREVFCLRFQNLVWRIGLASCTFLRIYRLFFRKQRQFFRRNHCLYPPWQWTLRLFIQTGHATPDCTLTYEISVAFWVCPGYSNISLILILDFDLCSEMVRTTCQYGDPYPTDRQTPCDRYLPWLEAIGIPPSTHHTGHTRKMGKGLALMATVSVSLGHGGQF